MEKKISEIKAELKSLSDDNLSCFIGKYEKSFLISDKGFIISSISQVVIKS